MTNTRPNLAFVIRKLSQFCCDSTIRYMNTLNRVLKYIRDTTFYGLRYQNTNSLKGFANAVYADDRDDRKTIYEFALICG